YESTPLGVKATFRYVTIFRCNIYSTICFSKRLARNGCSTRHSHYASRW
ncbi:hypothetical protein BV015_01169B, partial [Haemophilus influenzae]